MTAVLDGIGAVVVGRAGFVAETISASVDPGLLQSADAAEARGETVVWVGWQSQVRGAVAVADTVKSTSVQAIAVFRDLGLRPMRLTGDNTQAAGAVARHTGIAAEDVRAEVLPADKVAVVAVRLSADGPQVRRD
ncbi:MAG: HAD family hydrolase [Candidatus Phosphoribacter sp.]